LPSSDSVKPNNVIHTAVYKQFISTVNSISLA